MTNRYRREGAVPSRTRRKGVRPPTLSGARCPPERAAATRPCPSRQLWREEKYGLVKADLDVGALFEMDGSDEANLAFVEGKNHGRGADTFAEEAHALEKIAVRDAGAGEDDFFAGSEVVGIVDALGVIHAHFFQALLVFGLADDEACEDLAVKTAQSGGGEHTFGSAASAHNHVNAGANDGSGDAGGEVAVADQADARAGFPDVVDELLVARAVENDDDEVFDVAVEALGNGLQVVRNGGVEFNSAFARWPDDDFFHVKIGRMEKAAFFAGSKDGNGVRRPSGAEVGALKGVHGGFGAWTNSHGSAVVEADFFADVKHGSFVALAFTDDDGAIHLDLVHGGAHGFDGHFIGLVAVAKTHGASRGDGGILDHAQKIKAELFFHTGHPPRWLILGQCRS